MEFTEKSSLLAMCGEMSTTLNSRALVRGEIYLPHQEPNARAKISGEKSVKAIMMGSALEIPAIMR